MPVTFSNQPKPKSPKNNPNFCPHCLDWKLLRRDIRVYSDEREIETLIFREGEQVGVHSHHSVFGLGKDEQSLHVKDAEVLEFARAQGMEADEVIVGTEDYIYSDVVADEDLKWPWSVYTDWEEILVQPV